MLQAWFVRTGHPTARIRTSSMPRQISEAFALLSYPVLFEPMFSLQTQNVIWTGGYALLIVMIAACGVLLLRSPPMTVAAVSASDGEAPAPAWRRYVCAGYSLRPCLQVS